MIFSNILDNIVTIFNNLDKYSSMIECATIIYIIIVGIGIFELFNPNDKKTQLLNLLSEIPKNIPQKNYNKLLMPNGMYKRKELYKFFIEDIDTFKYYRDNYNKIEKIASNNKDDDFNDIVILPLIILAWIMNIIFLKYYFNMNPDSYVFIIFSIILSLIAWIVISKWYEKWYKNNKIKSYIDFYTKNKVFFDAIKQYINVDNKLKKHNKKVMEQKYNEFETQQQVVKQEKEECKQQNSYTKYNKYKANEYDYLKKQVCKYDKFLRITNIGELFDGCKIRSDLFYIPGQDEYIFVLDYVQTYFVENYIKEELNDTGEESKLFHQLVKKYNIDENDIPHFARNDFIKILNNVACNNFDSWLEAWIFNNLSNKIFCEMSYFKKYGLLKELSALSNYLLLNTNKQINRFIKYGDGIFAGVLSIFGI